ncbi:hypothetical protein OOT55_14705 [Marinimicrobium sp. C6131]|uniref:hypothetical protein n=1 Tax=Marinimicrobium sp. C6131 TaxID=3022676 RepID=UPI00223DCA5F|nr:hypothetical protein [Marinimicrobium sp. C6131]UZJ43896.1 hypothetical protein OOT55_14705 [Marinimicrobium sp. C6131]
MSRKIIYSIATVLLSLLLYPVALAMVIVADTLLGQAEFLNELFFGSRRELIINVLRDWASALPLSILLWFSVRGLSRYFPTRRVHALVISAGLLATVFSLFPPFLPMIFGALLFWAGILNLCFHTLWQRGNP